MGQEATCALRNGRSRVSGKAHLEGDHLLFRGGDTRVRISFKDLRAVEAHDGVLELRHADGIARFELGAVAARWAERIRNPRSLLDKLGIKPGMRVAVLNVDDEAFHAQLAERGVAVTRGRIPAAADVIMLGAEGTKDLERLARLRRAVAPAGAIWVVHRKGKGAALRDVDVFAAAKAVGLVDNKVASFSDTHTAEQLVIPRNQR